jgi:hypothetical protein
VSEDEDEDENENEDEAEAEEEPEGGGQEAGAKEMKQWKPREEFNHEWTQMNAN